MRLLLIVTLFFLNLLSVFSQTPIADINAWREKTRNTTFYKMEVRERGIYRIDYDNLNSVGFPVSTALLSEIRMFRRGEEVAIYIFDVNGNNKLDDTDYIEFYGEPNDGETDKHLFRDTNDFVNPYEPIYSRTAAYFLSSSALSGGEVLRFDDDNTFDPTGATTVDYHWYTEMYRDDSSDAAFDLRRSLSQGPSTNTFSRDRTSFSSAFRSPRSWSTYYNKGKTGIVNFQLKTNDFYSGISDTNFKLESRVMNYSYRTANIDFRVGSSADNTSSKNTQSVNRYDVTTNISVQLSDTDFANGSTSVLLVDNFNGEGADFNQMGVLYFNLTYPQAHSWIGTDPIDVAFSLYPTSKKIISAPLNNGNFYNISNPRQPALLQKNRSGQRDQSIVENTNGQKVDLYYSNGFKNVISLAKAEFEFVDNNLAYDYLIISHPELRQPTQNSTDPVKAYVDYRRSGMGGDRNAYAADILKLYNTFSWGEQNPIAIRNCIDLLRSRQLEYVLILGKGLDFDDGDRNGNSKVDPFEITPAGGRASNYVPSYGYPAADNAYMMGFDGKEANILPIGRISAFTPQIIEDYLNKVREHEQLEFNELWRKRALHLSGGADLSQQENFRKVIDQYTAIFTDTLEGGSVITISRQSDGAIETIDVSDAVNDGIALMTFYGHSSAQDADIDIGLASDASKGYQNQERYPLINMIGCGGGNLFTTRRSWGEDWIETPEKGAIGFVAKSGLGNSRLLENYGTDFYNATFKVAIGLPIGDHILLAQELAFSDDFSSANIAIVEQTGLQGDPFIKISPSKPDYAIADNNVLVTPQSSDGFSVDDNLFRVQVVVNNFGKALGDRKIYLQVKRKYGNGADSFNSLIDSADATYLSDTLSFEFINSEEDKVLGGGENIISVTVGTILSENEVIPEDNLENETGNNTGSVRVTFSDNTVRFIQPLDLSVQHDSTIDLYAFDNTFEQRVEGDLIEIEISKDSIFSSQGNPIKITKEPEQLIHHSINLSLIPGYLSDTTIIYARTRIINPTSKTEFPYNKISFTIIPNSSGEGWSQSNYHQMRDNQLTALIAKNDENGSETGNVTWEFPNENKFITVKTGGAQNTFYEVDINGEKVVINGECRTNGSLTFMIFDQGSGEVITADAYQWNNRFCGIGFPSKASVQLASSDLLVSKFQVFESITYFGPNSLFVDPKTSNLKDGDYVLAFSSGNFEFPSVPTNPDSEAYEAYYLNKEAMHIAGFDTAKLYNLEQGVPFIAWTQFKASPSEGQTIEGTGTNSFLDQSFTIQPDVSQGILTTSPIGKTNFFERLWMDFSTISGEIATTIQGLYFNENGSQITEDLYTFQGETPSTGLDLQNLVFEKDRDINDYNYITLKTTLTDTSSARIPSQLQHIRVSYATLPEAVMTYKDIADITDIKEVQQGQGIEYEFLLKNISKQSFKEEVPTVLTYKNENKIITDTITIPPLIAGGEYNFKIKPDTWGDQLTGNVSMSLVTNPDIQLLENFYNNNSVNSRFNVGVDNTNPLVEILFDGQRIISGDIVSPTSEVSISLIDENEFLRLENHTDDPLANLLTLSIKNEEDDSFNVLDSLLFSFENMGSKNHIIASLPLNQLANTNHIDIDGNIKDGIYTLQIEGRDVTGNGAGNGSVESANQRPYLQMKFEISKESTITNFYPYPNPFSDKVRFVFQVTGIEVPDQIKIQIMTVTGRVVKEIFQDELGPIRVGTNISEYAWDGRDEFGDQLANGVYLYRVIIPQKNSGEYQHRNTSKDNLFKHNIGKLYLLK
ncbi:putative type IX secretion system sortase PorU2 [Flammeovirga aprica]|uniref:Gingipain domain-containing protein n=1 Tax=Flammeovirga aprica JL-4 TaxID=694437 RepID=A0A7X9RSU1_9BACT|nr:C25 family cysteine peptidase [Flammeovirga aprica]NME66392.1 hypothetical protein [Flammeovirga aprica JL-4]